MIKQCQPSEKWALLARLIEERTGLKPNLDFGLATLEEELSLPKGSGFAIFAVGRCVGWMAHSFEQRKSGKIIRPRATDKVG